MEMNKATTIIGSLFGKLVLGCKSSCGGGIHRTIRGVANLAGESRIGSAEAINRCNEEAKPLSGPGSGPGHAHRVKDPEDSLPVKPKRYQGTKGGWFSWSRYPMDHPKNVVPATFAVEKYNNVKNAKLQLVRVDRVIEELRGGKLTQRMKLDAVDEQGVTKQYEAIVWSRPDRPDMMLEFFINDQAKNPDGSEIERPHLGYL